MEALPRAHISPPITRRALVGHALVASAAGVAAAPLAPIRAAAAAPPLQHGVITLSWTPENLWNNGGPWQQFATAAMRPFEAAHPGVRIQTIDGAGGAHWLPSMIAGAGPDLVQSWVLPPYVEAGALLKLNPYLQRDNVTTTIWSSGQMRAMETTTGTYSLPAYVNTSVLAVNLGLLNDLGVAAPTPDWSYTDAEHIFRTTSFMKGNTRHYGVSLIFNGHNLPWTDYAFRGFGGTVVDATGTRCVVDDPRTIRSLSWYDALYWDNVAGGPSAFTQNAFIEATSGNMVGNLGAWANAYDWTFFPPPAFPAGRFTFMADDFWAINIETKYPDLAFELLMYLTSNTTYLRQLMRIELLPPSLMALWPEYVSTIEAAAPVARSRGLEWFVQGVENWGTFGRPFKYMNSMAVPVLNDNLQRGFLRQQDLTVACRAAATGVNAIETSGEAMQAKAIAGFQALRTFEKANRPVALPPPSVQGSGVAPSLAPRLVVIDRRAGVYTLLGDGAGVGSNSDNFVYACAPMINSGDSIICRLVGLANVTCPSISPWAKVGLMARGDLSDNAPMVALLVTGANGVALEGRPLATSGATIINGSGGKSGLMSPQYTTVNVSKVTTNYLIQPLWLKLDRQGVMWTAYTSVDGKSWASAGAPVEVEMEGCWVGIGACGHNADFHDRGYIRAVFDNLNFRPTAFYQVGRSGVPPQAGTLPTNWAG